jgi:hypothetical protein
MRRFSSNACAVSLCACGLIVGLAASASAQGTGSASARRLEVSGGGAFVGGFDLRERDAVLTSNTGTLGEPFDFFSTDSRIKPAFGVLARIGFYVTASLAIEGGLRFTRPVHQVRITDDVEDAADTTAEETMSQYVIEGSAVWHFTTGHGARAVPFVYGGAGYLRELHEGDAFVEDGLEYHAGGGFKWWLGRSGRVGVRGEAGFSIRDGGFDLDDKRRIVPVVSGSVIYRF